MKKREIFFLSNVTIDLISKKLQNKYEVVRSSGFDTWISEIMNEDSALYKRSFDAVIILIDGTVCRSWSDSVEAEEHFHLWKQALSVLCDREKTTPIFVSTIDVRLSRIYTLSEISDTVALMHDWISHIKNLQQGNKNLFLYNMQETITDIGRQEFYSDKMWYIGGMPFSKKGIAQIVVDIEAMLHTYYDSPRKVIVLDLDNTLWGGVIGEDGIDGIELSNHNEGQRFYDFQKRLLQMKDRGVLLAIASKNNEEDVEQVFAEHPYMLLKKEDFVLSKINWNSKSSNIKAMENDLNLSENAFCFIDDNPMERAIVSGECQEVLVLDFPEDTTQLSKFAEEFYHKNLRVVRTLEEDRHKTEMYRAEEKREGEKAASVNFADYILRLEIEIDIHAMREEEIERVAQLCGKTNQFNLTTIRYSIADIRQMRNEPGCEIFVACVRDKFGDSGLVSVMIVKQQETKLLIDSFLMSCRVMGRMIENVIMDEIVTFYSEKCGIKTIVGAYIPTSKNKPVESLYSTLGFTETNADANHREYVCDVLHYHPMGHSMFKKVIFCAERE